MEELKKTLDEIEKRNGGMLTIFITNGFQIKGRIQKVTDKFVVFIGTDGNKKVIMLSAISTFE